MRSAALLQLAKRRLEQLVHVLPESIKQRSLHLHILSEQLHLARGKRYALSLCSLSDVGLARLFADAGSCTCHKGGVFRRFSLSVNSFAVHDGLVDAWDTSIAEPQPFVYTCRLTALLEVLPLQIPALSHSSSHR